MFGDMQGMMAKLQEAQAKIEETKNRLNTVMVDGDAGNGMVVVTVTANREIKNIAIDNQLLDDKEALEDYLMMKEEIKLIIKILIQCVFDVVIVLQDVLKVLFFLKIWETLLNLKR